MIRRFALLVDGAFMCKRLGAMTGAKGQPKTPPSALAVLAECGKLLAHPSLSGYGLLRIYYYDAPPATGLITNPLDKKTTNLGRTPQFAAATAFQDTIELAPDVALRKGELSCRGWRVKEAALKQIAKTGRALRPGDLAPNLEQKGVDLRIGLDIARLSLQRLVEVLVVVTGDSDMVPAFKFARREGIRVYLSFMGAPVKRDLKAHVDQII